VSDTGSDVLIVCEFRSVDFF